MSSSRSQWKSRFGFILAASGSAIGLGSIVFFPANAFKFGGGAFYLPYLVALVLVGMPVMIAEFGLGGMTKKSFPLAMRQFGGRFGEFFGWFAILNAGFITMYYITILGWVCGMGIEAVTKPVGEVFASSSKTYVPWLGGSGGELPNPTGTFFSVVSSWTPALAVLFVWLLNFLLVLRGTKTIEVAVKVFVPLMWVAMIVLAVQGILLPGGFDGVQTLFTPDTAVLSNPEVWQGAMAQMFFTLSLGFGVMTAYASYLPDRSDHTHNAVTTSLLNCGFEWIAGIAIFSMLFAFSIMPRASTLSMMFFITPAGIAEMGGVAQGFAIGFWCLLLVAGLTSSISLVEALVSAMHDKFGVSRMVTLLGFGVVGASGSLLFALPHVVNPGLEDDGTIGLTLVDLIDHWAFTYGLLLVGLVECLVIGWGLGARRLKDYLNERSRFRLGGLFVFLIRFVIPALILVVLLLNVVWLEFDADVFGVKGIEVDGKPGMFGSSYAANYEKNADGKAHWWLDQLHMLALIAWIVGTFGLSCLMTGLQRKKVTA